MALDVLIVDDSAAIRRILHRVLLRMNIALGQVHEANDGNEALERMRSDGVGLVLADINMPNMDGLEFLKSVKANPAWQDVPVMVVTTEGSGDRVLQALELGAAGYVKKPFSPSLSTQVPDADFPLREPQGTRFAPPLMRIDWD